METYIKYFGSLQVAPKKFKLIFWGSKCRRGAILANTSSIENLAPGSFCAPYHAGDTCCARGNSLVKGRPVICWSTRRFFILVGIFWSLYISLVIERITFFRSGLFVGGGDTQK